MTDEPRTPGGRQELESAAVVLGLARPMVDDDACLTADQLRWIARRLVESLAEVLRIAAGQCDPTPAQGGEMGTTPPPSPAIDTGAPDSNADRHVQGHLAT